MVKSFLPRLLSVVIVASTILPAAAVETVTRKSVRRTSSGNVEKITRNEVTLKSRSKTIKIPADDIRAIKWSREPPVLSIARKDERGHRLQKALDGYEESKKIAKSPQAGLKADLDFGMTSTTAKLALAGTGDMKEAAKRLEAFRSGHPDSYHFYDCLDLLGRLLTQQQQWDDADKVYAALEKSPLQEYKMAAEIGKARLLLKKDAGNLSAAITAFDVVIHMKPATPGEKLRRWDAVFGKVDALLDAKRHEDALGLVEQITNDPEIQDETLLARAYLRQGNCLVAAGKLKLAALAFLYVDKLLFKDKQAHAEALFRLSRLWENLGRPASADDAKTRLQTLYPNSEWAKRLN